MQTITAEIVVSATTTDVLGSTPLRTMPGPGAVAVYLASDQADWLASVSLGGRMLKTNSLIGKVNATFQINMLEDAPSGAAEVQGGEVLTVDVTEVTAGSGRAFAIWIGEPL